MTHDVTRLSDADLACWLVGFSTLRPQPAVTELLEECANRLRGSARENARSYEHERQAR